MNDGVAASLPLLEVFPQKIEGSYDETP